MIVIVDQLAGKVLDRDRMHVFDNVQLIKLNLEIQYSQNDKLSFDLRQYKIES